MPQTSVQPATTPYAMIGGETAVRQIVDRFYDLMDTDPQYRALRALHANDLGPMRASLSGFLAAWLGGPRDWFEERPGRCVMSAHRDVAVTKETATQWAEAMGRAIGDCLDDAKIAAGMTQALSRMASGMVPA